MRGVAGTRGVIVGAIALLALLVGRSPAAAIVITGGPRYKGYKYDDPSAIADGAQKMMLKAASTARAKLIVHGRGVNLGAPLVNPLLPLPVTAQLTNFDTGVCWETNYPGPVQNSPTSFKAKR